MSTTADIRNNAVIIFKSKRMKVIEFQHVKPGKGGAFVRTKLKDIQSGKIIDHTFNSGAKVEFIRVEAKEMQYLYLDGESYVLIRRNFDTIFHWCTGTTEHLLKKIFLTCRPRTINSFISI